MSKRKKQTRRPASRRRRGISGIGGNMNELVLIAAGAAAAPFLDKVVAKVMPTVKDKKILAGAKLAVGFVLPKVIKKPMINTIAKGIVATAAVQLAASLGIYGADGAGIGDTDGDVYVDMNNIAGTGEDIVGMEVVGSVPSYYPTINGTDDFENE